MTTGKVIIDAGGEVEIVSQEIHHKLAVYLEELLATGLYGHDTADVAVRLIERGVREAIEQRVIKVLE